MAEVTTTTENISEGYILRKIFRVGVDGGKFTARAKGKVIGDVNINVGPNGTTIEFTTDFDEGAIYRDVKEEYKSDKYKFLPKKGSNPEVKFNKDGYSVIKFSLVEIKK